MTRSQPAIASANAPPRARSAPWWTWTRSSGVKRAASRCQLPTRDIGQTSRVGPRVRLVREQGQQLHRLAQAHVVGEHAADADPAEEVQPGQTTRLVRAESPVEGLGRGDGVESLLGPARQQVAEPAVRLDPLDRQAVGVDGRRPGVDPETESEHLAGRSARRYARRVSGRPPAGGRPARSTGRAAGPSAPSARPARPARSAVSTSPPTARS